MMKSVTIALAALAGFAQAIEFTTTFTGQTLTKGSVVELDWSTVDTDPSTLSIFLVNFVQWPPLTYALAEDIDTFKGKTCVRIPCDVDSTSGYQFNAINGTNTYVIYAQTDLFSLKGNCTEPPKGTATVETVIVSATPVEICKPHKKVIFDIHDTIWVVPKEEHHIRTCDATAVKTVLAKEICTVTETIAASTVTLTVVGGTECPGPKPAGSPVPAPPAAPVPVTKIPYPVTTAGPAKNTTITKPVVFTSGAESNVRNMVAFVAGLAVIAAFVM